MVCFLILFCWDFFNAISVECKVSCIFYSFILGVFLVVSVGVFF